jgi:predicted NAD/FAD-dependent oxidoreductase
MDQHPHLGDRLGEKRGGQIVHQGGVGRLAVALEPAGDGHARWCGTRGMTDLPKRIAAALPGDLVEIRSGVRAAAVGMVDGGLTVTLEAKEGEAPRVLGSRGLVLSCPVPQSLDLFAAGDAFGALEEAAVETLRGIDYDPCFALMAVLDRPSLVPPPGGIQFESAGPARGAIAWLADNRQKGISPLPALTIHASGAFSRRHFDDDPATVTALLLEAARPWIDGQLPEAVLETSLQRWKFAQPTSILKDPLVAATSAPPIVCCGDAFAGPKVEGAASSGMAAARWVVRVLAAD